MTKVEIRDYTLKITQSSKTQLVVISYEIIINYLTSAKTSLEFNDTKDFLSNIKKAKEFVDNLLSSLDLQYKLSFELMNIYLFINRCLIEALAKKESNKIDRIISMIEKLKVGFMEVSKVDHSGPVIKDAQKVYAGLTYGKGTLNEYTVR